MPLPFTQTVRSLTAESPQLAFCGWAITAVLLAVWLGWFCVATVDVLETSNDARLEVEQTAYPINAATAGKVIRGNMSLGRRVAAGELLAELDSRREQLQLQEEEATLRALPVQLEALHQEIGAQNAAAEQDRLASLTGLFAKSLDR